MRVQHIFALGLRVALPRCCLGINQVLTRGSP